MTLDPVEAFGIFALGSFVLLAGGLVAGVMAPRLRPELAAGRVLSGGSAFFVFLLLAFLAGHLAQEAARLAEGAEDNVLAPFGRLNAGAQHRVGLFGEAPCSAPDPLAIESARRGLLSAVGGLAVVPIEAALVQRGRLRCGPDDAEPTRAAIDDQLDVFAARFFKTMRPQALANPASADALGRLEARIDVFRGMMVSGQVLFIVLILVLVIRALLWLLGGERRRLAVFQDVPVEQAHTVRSLALLIAGLSGCVVISALAVQHGERARDRAILVGALAGTHQPAEAPAALLGTGFSGFAALGGQEILAVHDTKAVPLSAGQTLPRLDRYLSIVTLSPAGAPAMLRRLNLSVDEGLSLERAPSDLEAVCLLSRPRKTMGEGDRARPIHALAFESGDFRRDTDGPNAVDFRARAYHIRLDQAAGGTRARLIGVIEFTELGLIDVEGALCRAAAGGPQASEDPVPVEVVLARRGGGADPARLHRLRLMVSRDGPVTLASGVEAGGLEAPWPREILERLPEGAARHVTDLSQGPGERVFVTAAGDAGDAGPFASLIYTVNAACLFGQRAVAGVRGGQPCHPDRGMVRSVPNVKLEALTVIDGRTNHLALGSDDEDLGGLAWGGLAWGGPAGGGQP